MDPLTHTLLGANLAATRLGTTTRLGAAALVIGANLPDVDAVLYFTGHSDLALGFRRGWTHGVLALVVLPFVLTATLLLYDRIRPSLDRSVNGRWLLLLSAIGVVTHPALDWLNNYGMRWLMPFRGTWFYGDAVYIMDPWLWMVLGCGWLAARRPTLSLVTFWLVFSGAIAWVVGRRSADYLIIVGLVALVLLAAIFWRAKRSLVPVALAIAFVYIAARLVINGVVAADVARQFDRGGLGRLERLMISPHPLDPTRWDVVAQTESVYRYGRYDLRRGGLHLAKQSIALPRESPEWSMARRDPSIRGFLTWVRFPWYEVERSGGETRVYVQDARYAVRRAGRGFGGVVVVIPPRRD
jgi:inner membrane protein